MTTFTPFVTFALFVLLEKSSGRELNTSMAFATLSLIGLLANPINTLLRTIPMLTSALACFSRIQAFLDSESRQAHVLELSVVSGLNKVQGPAIPEIGHHSDLGMELQDLSLMHQRSSNPLILDVRNASFAWGLDGQPIVNDVTFSVMRGDFLFIIGPVGCGKSSLLKGLLSETPSSKGFVYSGAKDVSFVDQTPWIQNITIRQNIIGQSSFDESWYNKVIRTCALDSDIAALPMRDGMCGNRF
jgi:ATP-binding cassette subfamily C (CFTR/MRP) protein 1